MLNCLSEGEEGGADHRFLTTVIASFGLETYGFFRRLRHWSSQLKITSTRCWIGLSMST